MSSTIKTILSKRKLGMKKIENNLRVVVEPEDAQAILDEFNIDNRRMKMAQVRKISKDMSLGEFSVRTGQNIKFDWDGKLIDGQNRMKSIVISGIPIELDFIFGLNPEVQKNIDRVSPRSTADWLKMNGYKYCTQIQAVATMLSAFSKKQSGLLASISNDTPAPSEIDAICGDYADVLQNICEHLQQIGMDEVTVRSYSAFVYFVLSQTNKSHLVDPFFQKLASGAMLAADDPISVVRNRLIIDSARLRPQRAKELAIGLMFKAWNMHINKQKTSNKIRTPLELPRVDGLEEILGRTLYS